MIHINDKLAISLYPALLFIAFIIFYIGTAFITGNVFRRGDMKFRPFAFSDPFTRPFQPALHESFEMWYNTSYWAWPFNILARNNPYMIFIIIWICSFILFTINQKYSDYKSDESQSERDDRIKKSLIRFGLSSLGITLLFSIILRAFFSYKPITEMAF